MGNKRNHMGINSQDRIGLSLRRLSVSVTVALLTCSVTLLMPGCNELSDFILNNEQSSDSSKTSKSVYDDKKDNPDDEKQNKKSSVSEKEDTRQSSEAGNRVTYHMSDIDKLRNVDHFAPGTLEHIFDGTINKKGNATGYHYTMVVDSKGELVEGTRSKNDKNGVFTGKVRVSGIDKNGFSSFYPESWSPQQVVDAINTAYDDAMSNPTNPSGNLWIGHCGDLEIDMYLSDERQITTAFPVYQKG